ncbi:MAG: hypothetical protein GC165_15635 [Armatimonadetes bacterium]|nr:hypothetical protein [Armatimonadota bacterium]
MKLFAFIGVLLGSVTFAGMAQETFAQAGAGGGQNSNPWTITYDYAGTDTYVYPKWDQSQGSYRLYTYTRDWKTGRWSEDGALLPQGVAVPSQASWNTPTSFSGSAESTGIIKITATWNGTGSPPNYMYLGISSSASSAELGDATGGSYSGSDGQGDPYTISGDSGESAGTHAKKLSVGSDNTASYYVSVSAKATKTGLKANLGAGCGADAALDPKALGVSSSPTYYRDEINTGTPEIRRTLVDSPEFDAQTCVFAAKSKWIGYLVPPHSDFDGGTVDRTYGVARLGNWVKRNESFVSSVDQGSKVELWDGGPTWDMFYVSGVEHLMDISVDDMFSMRTTPKYVTLRVQSTDPFSTNVGPFSGTMKAEIWAPARLLSSYNYDSLTDWYEPALQGPNGNYTLRQDLTAVGQSASLSFSITETDTYKFPVGLSTGVSFGGDIGFLKATVKADINRQIGDSQGFNISSGASVPIGPCQDPVEEWGLQIQIRTYYRDRHEALYDDEGYESDDIDTISNTQPANIIVRGHLFSSGGSY